MFFFKKTDPAVPFPTSDLYDEKTFYIKFLKDLEVCTDEIIIESPFITTTRMKTFYPVFGRLIERRVKIYIFTRPPEEHDEFYHKQAEREIRNFECMGIETLLCLGNHHRKLAILDRKILWEGSLNILSQVNSREIMRRISGEVFAKQMIEFLKIDNFL
jgi:hypothetical protein